MNTEHENGNKCHDKSKNRLPPPSPSFLFLFLLLDRSEKFSLLTRIFAIMEQYKNLVPSSVMKESFIIKKLYTYNDPLYMIKYTLLLKIMTE